MGKLDKYRKKSNITKSRGIASEKWKVITCPDGGKKCWCRMVVTQGTNSMVIPAAVIKQDLADYIVKLQNAKFK